MQAYQEVFTNLINGNTQYIIPVFQRDYSWSEPQCKQLWDDILNAAAGSSGQGHFIGSFVHMAADDSAPAFTRWLVVDGQQRLTTIVIILTALRDYLKDNPQKETKDATANRINSYFLKNIEESGDRAHKLVLRRKDNKTLTALLDSKEYPDDESDLITDNYEFFKNLIENSNIDVVYKGIHELVVVDVTLDRKFDNPQMVFESLNSTGLDLSNSDLVRNFVLLNVDQLEQDRLYREYWSPIETLFEGTKAAIDNFIRDYAAVRTKATRQFRSKDIYYSFRSSFKRFTEEDGSVEKTLEDMLQLARYYSAFAIGRDDNEKIALLFQRIRRLAEAPAMLITKLYQLFDYYHNLSEAEFTEALELIESYLMRRAVCRQLTKNYWPHFTAIIYTIGEDRPLKDLKVALARQPNNYRFPSEKEFVESLQNSDLYELRVCKFILDGLENHDSKEPTDTSKFTIEHIMPQNSDLPTAWKAMLGGDWFDIQSKWLHRLGNLTLTGYNSTYSDRPFDEKKEIDGGFNQSSVRLNQYVRDQDQWTGDEIQNRNKLLSKNSVKIWRNLEVDSTDIEAYEIKELKERATKRGSSNIEMTDQTRSLFDEISRNVQRRLGEDVIEIAEARTIVYYAPNFFMEVIPRKWSIDVLLKPDFNEIDRPTEKTLDTSEYTFVLNATQDGGILLKGITNNEQIAIHMPMILQAVEISRSNS